MGINYTWKKEERVHEQVAIYTSRYDHRQAMATMVRRDDREYENRE
jgi:hypothetical protein